MKRVQVLFLWIALAMMPWMAAARTDAFYEQRLKAGKDALAARRGPEAVEELRIAVFGFIDEPRLLSESLAYLAIAQNGLGRTAEVETTLSRFVESERRAAGYDRQALPEEVRVEFEALLTKQFGKTALSAIPSLAPLFTGDNPRRTAAAPAVPPVVPPAASQSGTIAQPGPQTEGRTTPSQGVTAAPAKTPENEVRTTGGGLPPGASVQPQPSPGAPRVPQNDAKPAQSSAAPVSQAGGDPADQARQMIATRKAAQAVSVLTPATEREPQRRELRLLLLQAAAMTSDWKLALAQISLLRPFSDSEPVFMFYAAVTMYESNRLSEARELLDRALPRLNRTPYVDSYVRKIQADRSAS